MNRKASIKETGEELSEADWARFDAAVASAKAERAAAEHRSPGPDPHFGHNVACAGRPRPVRR